MRQSLMALILMMTTPAMAEEVDVNVSAGTGYGLLGGEGMLEVEVKPVRFLSFATDVATGGQWVSVHETVRLHPLTHSGVDPYLGLSAGVFGGVYEEEPLRLLPGVQLGVQGPIVEDLFLAFEVQVDAWTYPGSDRSLLPSAHMRVGWTF